MHYAKNDSILEGIQIFVMINAFSCPFTYQQNLVLSLLKVNLLV